MKIDIIEETESPLLSRKTVRARASFEGATPSRAELRGAMAKKADASEDNTIITHVYSQYGNTEADVVAHIYSKEADKKNVESGHLLKKHVKEEPKKEEAPAPAAEAPAEAPVEEKTEAPQESPEATKPAE